MKLYTLIKMYIYIYFLLKQYIQMHFYIFLYSILFSSFGKNTTKNN